MKNYSLNDNAMKEFKELAITKGITWDDKAYKIDEDFFKTYIKAYIAQSIWNRSKFMQVFYSMDKQVLKASELFPEAQKIAKIK